jgi:hypothetical protein
VIASAPKARADGSAWDYFTHDQSRSRAYRWGEDGLAGFSDDRQELCFCLGLWNDLVKTNRQRSRTQPEYELIDTGVFDDDRYFDSGLGLGASHQTGWTGIVARLAGICHVDPEEVLRGAFAK